MARPRALDPARSTVPSSDPGPRGRSSARLAVVAVALALRVPYVLHPGLFHHLAARAIGERAARFAALGCAIPPPEPRRATVRVPPHASAPSLAFLTSREASVAAGELESRDPGHERAAFGSPDATVVLAAGSPLREPIDRALARARARHATDELADFLIHRGFDRDVRCAPSAVHTARRSPFQPEICDASHAPT